MKCNLIHTYHVSYPYFPKDFNISKIPFFIFIDIFTS